MITPSPTYSPAKRPASPTSSLEMIISGRKETRKKNKASGKSFLPTFWDDADAATLKAYKALSVDDLGPLMAKSSSTSLSAENERLENKVAILTAKAENDKERVATLEKCLQVEKDICKLKDKQIGDLELKLQNVGATTVPDFKDSNEYSDDMCKYYVKGFDLLVKWIAKHHLDLDLSGLAVDDVEKELMSDRPFEATVENVTEEVTDAAEVMKKALTDSVPDEQ
nr:hypothetical protein CFP56_68709 [Quercus suber]